LTETKDSIGRGSLENLKILKINQFVEIAIGGNLGTNHLSVFLLHEFIR